LSTGSVPHCHQEIANYFRDVEDHLLRVVGEVEGLRDVLSDALYANLAQVGVQQNEHMRTISAWVAIGGVPTVVGAIYGMNFEHMPELEQLWTYPAVMVATLLACVFLYRKFKDAGWL
ncbi:MAG: CorA family divalent cation transporter, partial [Acidimicrobiales bacterium]